MGFRLQMCCPLTLALMTKETNLKRYRSVAQGTESAQDFRPSDNQQQTTDLSHQSAAQN